MSAGDHAVELCDCSPCEYAQEVALYHGEADSISWGELAQLTHATQLERFGFCSCEDPGDGDLPYFDCPRYAGNGELISVNESGLFIDSLGRFGYRTWLSGDYVCYSCGHLCDPDRHGWESEE